MVCFLLLKTKKFPRGREILKEELHQRFFLISDFPYFRSEAFCSSHQGNVSNIWVNHGDDLFGVNGK